MLWTSRRSRSDRPISAVQPPSRSVLCGVFAAGYFLVVLELVWLFGTGLHHNVYVSLPFYLTATTAVTLGAWLLHTLPVAALDELLRRRAPRWRRAVFVGGATVFGILAQHALMQGDGIVSHPHYQLIRATTAALAALALASFAWLLASPRAPFRLRMWAAGVALLAALPISLLVFPEYQPFHGYLAAWIGVLFAFLTRGLDRAVGARRALIGTAVIAAVAAAALVPERQKARTHVQRFSHIPASLTAGLPLGSLLRVPSEDLFALDDTSPEARREIFEAFRKRRAPGGDRTVRGDSVVLIVLESVRADDWDDPELTPAFHRWKDEGVYVPRAVAQYPATPLAYGAMFTSQPPSVVAQTPYWGRHRLFDGIRSRFDRIVLSRPDNRWFEHTAITDFFVPRDHPVNAHESAPAGLDYLRRELSATDDDDSFFAWIHLYEPHHPYEPREPWAEGRSDRRSAYRSEIAYTDEHLGRFMRWFYAEPIADDALVIVVADHGQGMGERIVGRPFWGHHVHVANVVSHIPMFFSGPDLPAGRRDEDLGVAQLDVMPTIYDFVGVGLPEALMPQGHSIYQLLDERPVRPLVTEAFSIRGTEFFEFVEKAHGGEDMRALRRQFRRITTRGQRYSPKIGMQYGRHKLVYDRLLQRGWLYDIDADPGEREDLFEREPDVADEMTARLQRWHLLQSEVVRRLDDVDP